MSIAQSSIARVTLLVSLCFFLLPCAWGQQPKRAHFAGRGQDVTLSEFENSGAEYRRTRRKRTIELSLPTRDGIKKIKFEPHDIRSSKYRASIARSDGEHSDKTEIDLFKGSVVGGASGEFARIAVIREPSTRRARMRGVMKIGADYYDLSSPDSISVASTSLNVEAPSDDELQNIEASCATSEVSSANSILSTANASTGGEISAAATTLKQVEIASEADFDYVQALGSGANANAEILAIINGIDGIYQDQLGLTFSVTFQHAWEVSTDPYSSTDSAAALNEFTSHWSANFTSNRYDVAHLWTDRNLNGSTVGIAWVGVVCRSSRYGLSQRLSSRSLTVPLAAHEIGHNFGANHDTCTTGQNWVMCPSLIANSNKFSTESLSSITSYVDRQSCLSPVVVNPSPQVPTSPLNLMVVTQ